MAKVKCWYSQRVAESGQLDELRSKLPSFVVMGMECLKPNGEPTNLDPNTGVSVPVFHQIEGTSSRDVLVEISAFPFPDRTRAIKGRLKTVGIAVSGLLGLEPEAVNVYFDPLDEEHFARV